MSDIQKKIAAIVAEEEKEDCGTGFGIRHKVQAREFLKTLGH